MTATRLGLVLVLMKLETAVSVTKLDLGRSEGIRRGVYCLELLVRMWVDARSVVFSFAIEKRSMDPFAAGADPWHPGDIYPIDATGRSGAF